jgi:phenylacetate-CoA ligase
MNPYRPFDALENRSPEAREAALMAALPHQVAHAQASSAAMAEHLQGVDAAAVNTRAAMAKLPVLRKATLLERQKALRASDPFGGYSVIGWGVRQARGQGARRVFQSPGPIYEPEGHASDYWRIGRAMHAAGFVAGDLIHNSFSYHLTPAGSMMETGAHALGCTVFAGGVGNTELQLQAIQDLRPQAYAGTPSFLRILFEKAEETKTPLPTMTKALCSGEAFPPSLVQAMRERGVEGYQCYATADVGLIAYETAAREGLVIDEGVLVEIVRPGTNDPVPDGEVGEVVVTVFHPDYPLVRFGTGDLSAVLAGPCPTGRTNMRIKGWMGRADQTAKVRGMFVHPSQVAEIVKRHPELARARLVVSGEQANDQMLLRAEAAHASSLGDAARALSEQIAVTVRDVTKLRADVELVAPGALPNDGKVIEDARSYK